MARTKEITTPESGPGTLYRIIVGAAQVVLATAILGNFGLGFLAHRNATRFDFIEVDVSMQAKAIQQITSALSDISMLTAKQTAYIEALTNDIMECKADVERLERR
ncbi:MAG: hypothetical protein AB2803_17760 [Candidatus Thiodiazotropha sp.]